MRSTLASWWYAFANTVGGLFDEAAYRVELAFKVLTGRVPLKVEKRSWSKVVEAPVLVDVYDWTDERRIFSVLVWPPLEAPADEAYSRHDERVSQVLEVIARGASEKALSTRWDVDYGLAWDAQRQVWTAKDGFAYALPEERTTREGEGAT